MSSLRTVSNVNTQIAFPFALLIVFMRVRTCWLIHPDECIDCGVCEPECPADAIKPDSETELEPWLKLNAEFSKKWPVIVNQKDPPTDADEWLDKPSKLAWLSDAPARE